MIIKLLPEQLNKYWELIRFGILQSTSPLSDNSPSSIQNILMNMLTGTIQCWFILEKEELYSFVLTLIIEDPASHAKVLNIYDFYSYKQMPLEMWEEGITALKIFAKANNCLRITAYSNIPSVVSISEKMGFSSDTRFLMLEVTQ